MNRFVCAVLCALCVFGCGTNVTIAPTEDEPTLRVLTAILASGERTVYYGREVLTASGGDGSYTWRLASGSDPLPTGLVLNTKGRIYGRPTTSGTSTFVVEVTSGTEAADRELTIDIAPNSSLTHGPMVGGVTSTSAVVWVRTTEEATVQIRYASSDDADAFSDSPTVLANAATDYTAKIPIEGLTPATTYRYQVVVQDRDRTPDAAPTFTTFADDGRRVRIGILADLHKGREYDAPAIPSLASDAPDVVLVIGDWDHRDVDGLEETRIMHRETRAWRMRAGVLFRDHILPRYPVDYMWDDHDYAGNNSDKTYATKGEAIQAYDEYWPGYERPNPAAGIWHNFHVGPLVEVFMLDLRSQRDRNSYLDPDYIPVGAPGHNRLVLRNDPDRSMLDGDAAPEGRSTGQKQWLMDELRASQATWKLIVSTVPWNSTTVKDDAWWDFLAEREELLNFIESEGIEGVVVVSGDIHTGGAIDDGTNAGLPEFSVATVNTPFYGPDQPTCSVHPTATSKPQGRSCGDWSHGYRDEGRGYGLISFDATSALIEAKDESGSTVFSLSLPVR